MDNEREDEMKGQDKQGREDRKEKGEIGENIGNLRGWKSRERNEK